MLNRTNRPPLNPIPPAERRCVKPVEAAALLSVSTKTLERLTKRGEIPSIGRGRLRRYAVGDLDAWIARNRQGAA